MQIRHSLSRSTKRGKKCATREMQTEEKIGSVRTLIGRVKEKEKRKANRSFQHLPPLGEVFRPSINYFFLRKFLCAKIVVIVIGVEKKKRKDCENGIQPFAFLLEPIAKFVRLTNDPFPLLFPKDKSILDNIGYFIHVLRDYYRYRNVSNFISKSVVISIIITFFNTPRNRSIFKHSKKLLY